MKIWVLSQIIDDVSRNLVTPRFDSGMVGLGAQTLPLCYFDPPTIDNSQLLSRIRSFNYELHQ